ncbi:nucleolar protein 58-like [Lytechinus pictus]|uniref:nucleolar protein 58-like n=1 Tax=Lytechinus pictus TaxID=7653 RepID=UPI0030B9B080
MIITASKPTAACIELEPVSPFDDSDQETPAVHTSPAPMHSPTPLSSASSVPPSPTVPKTPSPAPVQLPPQTPPKKVIIEDVQEVLVKKPRYQDDNPFTSHPEKLSSPMKKKKINEEIATDDGLVGHIPRVSGLEISDGDEEQDTESKKNKRKAKRKHEKKEVSEENSKLDKAEDVLDESEGSPRKKKKKKKSKDK